MRVNLCWLLLGSLLFLLNGCAVHSPEARDRSLAREGPHLTGSESADGKGFAGLNEFEDDDWNYGETFEVADPFEPANRVVFALNHEIYRFVVKPASKAYQFLLPELVRNGIRNAFTNLRFPGRLVNHSLQGRFDRAALETGKFLVNTTAGVGGLMRPADKIPALAEVPSTDTGQTLARWGIPHGPYQVWPLLGPSTARESAGYLGDVALNPATWIGFVFGGAAWTLAITTPSGTHSLPDQMEQYDTMTQGAVDPYVASRTGYIQFRDAAAVEAQ